MTDKVVIQFGDRVLKGLTQSSEWNDAWNRSGASSSPPIRLTHSEVSEQIPLHGVKAVFFVHSFEGNKQNSDLRFHDDLRNINSLWIRVTFHDNELIEGIITNSGDFVLRDGFFMSPVNPEGNNWRLYIRKSQVKDLHVLGLRSRPT